MQAVKTEIAMESNRFTVEGHAERCFARKRRESAAPAYPAVRSVSTIHGGVRSTYSRMVRPREK